MGRKLYKSTRHKKLKAVDPFYLGERKLFIDKNLVDANQDPFKDDGEEQKLPMKLREYMELNEKIKQKVKENKSQNNKSKKKVKKVVQLFNNKPDESGAEVPVRQVPEIKRLPRETDAAYLNRIDREVEVVLNRSKFETQFECKIETKDDKVVVKKEKKMSDRKKRQLMKLKEKIKHKKEKKNDKEDDYVFKDDIKFGDVVHQPPSFTVLPKITKKHAANAEATKQLALKPGKKQLLLKEKLNEQAKKVKIDFTNSQEDKERQQNPLARPVNVACPTIPKHVKTAHGITEADRNAVIQSYRQLKKSGKIK